MADSQVLVRLMYASSRSSATHRRRLTVLTETPRMAAISRFVRPSRYASVITLRSSALSSVMPPRTVCLSSADASACQSPADAWLFGRSSASNCLACP